MTNPIKNFLFKKTALLICLCLLTQIFFPTIAFALTSGPTQPEFSTFEPVSTTQMVNEFTGDFTYNLPVIEVPGPNGSSYPLSLSYHSGISSEQEASWVGLGWTINPGSINRSKSGFPDDWKGETVEYFNKTPKNKTTSVSANLSGELLGLPIKVGVDAGYKYNSYKGFGAFYGFSVGDPNGVMSLNYSKSDGEAGFSFTVSPAALANAGFKHLHTKNERKAVKSASEDLDKLPTFSGIFGNFHKIPAEIKLHNAKVNLKEKSKSSRYIAKATSNYGYTFTPNKFGTTPTAHYSGETYAVNYSTEIDPIPLLPFGPNLGVGGNYTFSKTVAVKDAEVYGYLHSGAAYSNPESLMDYNEEKSSPYTRQARHIGVPISNSDNYVLSGEGLGGSFRPHQRKAGYYRPDSRVNRTLFFNVGGQGRFLASNGGGVSASGGRHLSISKEWNTKIKFDHIDKNTIDESVFFRFSNDLGGFIDFGQDCYGVDISPALPQKKFDINVIYGEPGTPGPGVNSIISEDNGYEITPSVPNYPNNNERVRRSSFIDYNFNKDIQGIEGVMPEAYEKSENVLNKVYHDNIKDQIGEFSIVKENGSRYNYGLPVYARKEKNISFSFDETNSVYTDNKYLVETSEPSAPSEEDSDDKYYVGESRETPYATSYLITSITSPDYVDMNLNGPDINDLGGWTKFQYHRAYGTDNKSELSNNWFKWRSPYKGYIYNKGQISTEIDDMANYSSGEKEIYYMKKIETASHFATFITSDRNDGISSNLSGAGNSNPIGSQSLKKLDKILLYSKVDNGDSLLIKTVHFEYSYNLCQGVLNSNVASGENGKLTLKKVWFEYEDVVNSFIQPYKFEYNYPSVNYPEPYFSDIWNYNTNPDGIQGYGATFNQNPTYDIKLGDAWGNYRSSDVSDIRHKKRLNGPDQSPDATFDPAAWHLKVIKLPSGGEIHVQYEQDDYLYVQNQSAHALVSIKAISHSIAEGTKYKLNTSEIGIDPSDLVQLKNKIADLYLNTGKKMRFRFLYGLLGRPAGLENPASEFIEGYGRVTSVGIENNDLYISLGGGGPLNSPKEVCKDFVKKNRGGGFFGVNMFAISDNATANVLFMTYNLPSALIAAGASSLNMCGTINESESYFRIPVLDSKLGGGVRVKRLLMYDSGLGTGSPELYGKEYDYTLLENGRRISSGVATYEPMGMREENPMVEPLTRGGQGTLEKMIAGTDMQLDEGPLGESLMPSPSVGYAMVTESNIHKGETTDGFKVSTFKTAKDHPVEIDYSDLYIKNKGPRFKLDVIEISLKKSTTLEQGFCFKFNNMHGKPISQMSYRGQPNKNTTGADENILVSGIEYEYFSPNEEIPIMRSYGDYGTMPLGREMEHYFATKLLEDDNVTYQGAMDSEISGAAPILLPFLTSFVFTDNKNVKKYFHASTRTVYYPSFVKSIIKTNYDHIQKTENKYFDPNTGRVLVTKSTDEYNGIAGEKGSVYNYVQTAPEFYSQLGQIAQDQNWKAPLEGRLLYKEEAGLSTLFTLNEFGVGTERAKVGPGSVIKITDKDQNGIETFKSYFQVLSKDGGVVELVQYGVSESEFYTGSSSSDFVDFNGNNSSIEVVRSQYTNQLNTMIGEFATHGEAEEISNSGYLAELSVMDNSLTNVITAMLPPNPQVPMQKQALDNSMGFNQILNPQTGNCEDINGNSNLEIHVTENNIGIYKRVETTSQIPQYYNSNPVHPLVADLNNYLSTYFKYSLGRYSNIVDLEICQPFEECDGSEYPKTIDMEGLIVRNIDGGVEQLRSDQDNFFTNTYNDINGETKVLSSFLYDECINENQSTYLGDKGKDEVFNYEIKLKETANGNYLGFEFEDETCRNYRYNSGGEFINNCDVFNSLGTFTQNEDGALVYSFEGEEYITSIRFYSTQTITNISYELLYIHNFKFPLSSSDPNVETVSTVNSSNMITVLGDQLWINYTDQTSEPLFTEAFCLGPKRIISNALSASAVTLTDELVATGNSTTINPYTSGIKGKYRPLNNYVYKNAVDNTGESRSSGSFNFNLFDWKSNTINSNWISPATIEFYSQNGLPLQERNTLGIPSAVKYNKFGQPIIIADNSEYSSIFSENFEEESIDGDLSDGIGINNNIKHTGNKSLVLNTLLKEPKFLGRITISDQLKDKGGLSNMWIKVNNLNPELMDNKIVLFMKQLNNPNSEKASVNFSVKEYVDGWIKVETQIDFSSFPQFNIGDEIGLYLNYFFIESSTVWIDDFSFYPSNASINTFVYDNNKNTLLASLDDQRFALIYQYNQEGLLIRKMKETQSGIKTISEGFKHTKESAR